MNRTILITGATSGFGKAIAEKFASTGDHLLITGRRSDRLNKIAESLSAQFKVRILPLVFDVQDKQQVKETLSKIPTAWQAIDILINNAGLAAGRDYFDEAALSDWETMIDTNVKGLLYVTKAILPFMITRKQGHIINIGSTAAKEVYEKGNVYCASKSAVDALSQAMRIDLLRHGIKITAVHPGAAETEFSLVRLKGDQEAAAKVYEGFQPLRAEDVAGVVHYCASLPAHVCINDVVMTATAQANSFYFHKSL